MKTTCRRITGRMLPVISLQVLIGLVVTFGLFIPSTYGKYIIQPVSVTAQLPMGAQANFGAHQLINQSGLSVGYTSGVTDFNTYITSGVTHTSLPINTRWASTANNPFGNLDFDLGGAFTIKKLAFWNMGGDSASGVVNFSLFADDNAAFSSPTLLGSFTADPFTGPFAAVVPEVFSFPATSADFVRLRITSNHGSIVTQAGEVAFEIVPEPGTLGLLGLGGVMVIVRRRRNFA